MSENSERYFLKEVANLEKTQTNEGTDSGTLRRPRRTVFRVNKTAIKPEEKNLNYGGKKSARKLKHWKTPFTEPRPSYRDRQRKPTE